MTDCDAVEYSNKSGGIHNDKRVNSSKFGNNSSTRTTKMVGEADKSEDGTITRSVGVWSSVVVNTTVASSEANREAVDIVNVNAMFRPVSSCLRQPSRPVLVRKVSNVRGMEA